MKKTTILVLVAALLLPCILMGCNTTPPTETTPEITTPEVTTPEVTAPEITNPQFSIPPIPAYNGDGITSENVLKRACIIAGEGEAEIYAKEELAAYLTKKNVEIADGGFPIILIDDASLETDSFLIDATLRGEEAAMTIRGGGGRGVLYAVYHFLEEYAGVRYFTPGLEKIPEGDVVLRDGNLLSYKPYFESRRTNWNCIKTNTVWCTKQGINSHDGILTSDKFGDKQTYAPGLFVHTLGKLAETGSATSKNPCLSDPAIFEKVLKNVRAILKQSPNSDIVSISQTDSADYCTCDACAAVDREEGSPAGLMLRFVNKIAEELEKDYPNLIVDTLAYNYTQSPPRITVPRHNVCVRLCGIRNCYTQPLDECNNYSSWTRTHAFLRDFVAWGKICDRLYIWEYTTNYRYYVPNFANFGVLRENMRLYHENGVRGIFSQGNSQSVSGEFGELRAYLIAKLMWNPYMDEEEYYAHMDEFLEAYYGEGWQYIRKYIDKTTELASDSCMGIYQSPFTAITEEEYLANEADFENWWTQAEALAGDRIKAVQRSRLQWRYIQLVLHPDEDACEQFTKDVNQWGILWAENPVFSKPPNGMFPGRYPSNGNTEDAPQDDQDPAN